MREPESWVSIYEVLLGRLHSTDPEPFPWMTGPSILATGAAPVAVSLSYSLLRPPLSHLVSALALTLCIIACLLIYRRVTSRTRLKRGYLLPSGLLLADSPDFNRDPAVWFRDPRVRRLRLLEEELRFLDTVASRPRLDPLDVDYLETLSRLIAAEREALQAWRFIWWDDHSKRFSLAAAFFLAWYILMRIEGTFTLVGSFVCLLVAVSLVLYAERKRRTERRLTRNR